MAAAKCGERLRDYVKSAQCDWRARTPCITLRRRDMCVLNDGLGDARNFAERTGMCRRYREPAEYGSQLFEDRARRVCLVVHLIAHTGAAQKARVRKQLEFTVQRASRNSRESRYFADVQTSYGS